MYLVCNMYPVVVGNTDGGALIVLRDDNCGLWFLLCMLIIIVVLLYRLLH